MCSVHLDGLLKVGQYKGNSSSAGWIGRRRRACLEEAGLFQCTVCLSDQTTPLAQNINAAGLTKHSSLHKLSSRAPDSVVEVHFISGALPAGFSILYQDPLAYHNVIGNGS